jgi:hypothetical protein
MNKTVTISNLNLLVEKPIPSPSIFFFMINNLLREKGIALIHKKNTRETTTLKASKI